VKGCFAALGHPLSSYMQLIAQDGKAYQELACQELSAMLEDGNAFARACKARSCNAAPVAGTHDDDVVAVMSEIEIASEPRHCSPHARGLRASISGCHLIYTNVGSLSVSSVERSEEPLVMSVE